MLVTTTPNPLHRIVGVCPATPERVADLPRGKLEHEEDRGEGEKVVARYVCK
jgi:hypothetical protein